MDDLGTWHLVSVIGCHNMAAVVVTGGAGYKAGFALLCIVRHSSASLSLPPLTCFPSPLVGFPGCAQNALETSQTEFVEREIETEKQVTTLENAGRQLKVSAGKSSLVGREDH